MTTVSQVNDVINVKSWQRAKGSSNRAVPSRSARMPRMWGTSRFSPARLVAIILAISTSSVILAPAAHATVSQTSTAISSAQSQAASLEASIAQEQQQASQLSEQYDLATYHLQQVQAKMATTNDQLDAARQTELVARRQLLADAVNAYVFDTPAGKLANLFSSPTGTNWVRNEYQNAAIGNVTQAVDQLHNSELNLTTIQGQLQAQATTAQQQAVKVRQSQQQATAASDAAQATLGQVKGQLGQLIAQQAAQQAAQAAAAAASASSAAAKQQAAQAAAAAAQVAATLGGGSAAATNAANSANQAAGTALGPVSGTATGSSAGEAAVAAAESYLGVPYVWGGASKSGVDCSGLVLLAWQAAGVQLVHSAAIQSMESTPVPLDKLQPGDLLFYDLDGLGIDHVVMYVGSGPYGTNTIIQAATFGTNVSLVPIWYAGLVGAGRP